MANRSGAVLPRSTLRKKQSLQVLILNTLETLSVEQGVIPAGAADAFEPSRDDAIAHRSRPAKQGGGSYGLKLVGAAPRNTALIDPLSCSAAAMAGSSVELGGACQCQTSADIASHVVNITK